MTTCCHIHTFLQKKLEADANGHAPAVVPKSRRFSVDVKPISNGAICSRKINRCFMTNRSLSTDDFCNNKAGSRDDVSVP